jgi:hypothetical protein
MGGSASFDDVTVKTDDPQYIDTANAMMASEFGTATFSPEFLNSTQLDVLLGATLQRWGSSLIFGEALNGLQTVELIVADLPGLMLGYTRGTTIILDADAAGHGWYVDASPASSDEFRIRLDDHVLAALPDSEAHGNIDLVTVFAHEVGHLLGLTHGAAADYPVMKDELDPGIRFLIEQVGFDHDPDQPISDQILLKLAMQAARTEQALRDGKGRALQDAKTLAFDLDALHTVSSKTGTGGKVDWDSGNSGWFSRFSSFGKGRAGSHISDFMSSAPSKTQDDSKVEQTGFDSLDLNLISKDAGKEESKGWFDL